MLPEEIKQLMQNTTHKERNMTSPTELAAALNISPIFQLNIHKPKEESLLHHLQVDTPPIVSTFYDQHPKELLNFLQYMHTLGLANKYHRKTLNC